MVHVVIDCARCGTVLQIPPWADRIVCSVCGSLMLHRGRRPLLREQGSHERELPSDYRKPATGRPNSVSFTPKLIRVDVRKKALLCGISYKNKPYELKGCINDVKCMKYLLTTRFNFPESSILTLTEEEIDPRKIPTRQNIQRAMRWLIQGCQYGDSLLFHYSGHGLQQPNYKGDEVDGYDEVLCPLDFESQGTIVDDEINMTIVRPLPPGVRLHAIIDSCHSGTMLDLPYIYWVNKDGTCAWEDHTPPTGAWKGTSGGEAISISGCDDDQTSSDTKVLAKTTSTGAMTFSFINAIENGNGMTYGSLLNTMRNNVSKACQKKGQKSTLTNMLLMGCNYTSGRIQLRLRLLLLWLRLRLWLLLPRLRCDYCCCSDNDCCCCVL